MDAKSKAEELCCLANCTEPHQLVTPHDLHLEHWLRLLGDSDRYYLRTDGKLMYRDNGVDFEHVNFNLTTGQPATEADYQKVCGICSL